MAVTVKLPTQLRDAVGGAPSAQAEGATVGEVLAALYAQHAELRNRMADDGGGLRRFVNVYLAGEDIRFLDCVDRRVADGAELAVSRRSRADEDRRAPARRAGAGPLVRVRAAAHGRGGAGVVVGDRGAARARAGVRLGHLRRGRLDPRADAGHR